MKRIALALGAALTLLANPITVNAHGGCFGFWPFWPLAFGTGIALGTAAYHDSCYYPRYVYAGPPYAYYPYRAAPTTYVTTVPGAPAPIVNDMPAPPTSAPAADWVPSSPGPGHWVPDPHPYAYAPGKPEQRLPVAAMPAAQTVTVTSSPGKVPIYTITTHDSRRVP